jgi:FkbM family methyltransferase
MSLFKNTFNDFIASYRHGLEKILFVLGRQIPNIPILKAIPNRVLKPIHLLLNRKSIVVSVLGFKMRLNPAECVDGNLYFSPQLYDKIEINWLKNRMPYDGVFVDVGGNIGFWSLYFASMFPRSKVIAIEANPDTFNILNENIMINDYSNIKSIQLGVSDEFGVLDLCCNDSGNRGADSFLSCPNDNKRRIRVLVKPLLEILISTGVSKIDILKIDIEGFEMRVLTRFFSDAPFSIWPKFICAEVSHVPETIPLLETHGYKVVLLIGENCIFEMKTIN